MKKLSLIIEIVLGFLLLAGTVFSADKKLPVVKGKEIVATVNNEPITADEFNSAISSFHSEMPKGKSASKIDYSKILDRLVNIKLVVQEAHKIGIDELPEIKEMNGTYSNVILRELLVEDHLKNIKPDEAEVAKIYKKTVKEYKIKSVIFEKEDDAKKMKGEIKNNKNFNEITKKYIKDNKAKSDEQENYIKNQDILPEMRKILSKMKTGSVSEVVPIKSGFVVFQLKDVRFPANAEARKSARDEALTNKKAKGRINYNNQLKKQYVKINEKLLKNLDYESPKPGFQTLLKDKRVVAEVEGEKPVTVGDLSENIKQKFYHGVDTAIKNKKINNKKTEILDEMIYKQVLTKEAFKKGIDKTEKYKNMVREYEDSIIFGAFLQKAIVPEIKIKEEELKKYYNTNITDYTSSEMIKINSIVFAKKEDADNALEKLRKGTDFKWIKDNANGQVDRNTEGILTFENNVLTIKSLSEDLKKAVAGTKSGDFRLYEDSQNKYVYVLYIQEVYPPVIEPFEEVKKTIENKVIRDKMNTIFEEWIKKLREASDIKIHLTDFN